MEMIIDDELETEIDIVYSGELDNEVNLFQYPLVPKENLNSSSIHSISFNRQNALMKIEQNLDKRTLNQHSQKVSSTHTLIGERIEANTNLLIGVFRDNSFYLTPVANIFQFRHDFSKSEGANEVISTKKKVDRRDYRNTTNALVKNEKEEMDYSPLMIFNINSIESCSMIEKINSVGDRHLSKANAIKFLSKGGYYSLLLKYINDRSIIDELNEKAIPPDHSIEDTIFSSNKNNKGALMGLPMKSKDAMKDKGLINEDEDNRMHVDDDIMVSDQQSNRQRSDSSVLLSIVQTLFGKNDCLAYDKLLTDVIDRLKLKKDDSGQLGKLESEIKHICFITSNRICFLKTKGEDEETNTIRLKLLELLSLNNESGVKRAKVTSHLKESNVAFKANVVSSILNSIGKKGKNELWYLKDCSK